MRKRSAAAGKKLGKPYRPKSREEIARNMSAIRSINNKTEVALRKELFRRGLRYRTYRKDLPGCPDLVFVSARVVVFVDGDYWHARTIREHGLQQFVTTLRTSRGEYWINKFQRRISLDEEVTAALETEGWTVLRIWESEVKRDLTSAANMIMRVVSNLDRPGKRSP